MQYLVSPESPSKGRGKIEFMRVIDDVREAIELGWSLHEIWKQLSDQELITVKYSAFTKLVKSVILNSTQPVKKRANIHKKGPEVATYGQDRKNAIDEPKPHDVDDKEIFK